MAEREFFLEVSKACTEGLVFPKGLLGCDDLVEVVVLGYFALKIGSQLFESLSMVFFRSQGFEKSVELKGQMGEQVRSWVCSPISLKSLGEIFSLQKTACVDKSGLLI